MFRKVLIANRGEIALRIIRTCKKLGVKTVGVYSDPDIELRHVVEADEAVHIGPGEPSKSYLSIPSIMEAANESNADAVHPGYGFLAENPDLARACEESGLTFIGPPNSILGRVANKLESKRVVSEAGIPVIPGSQKEVSSLEDAESEARRIGFPILVKAVFGGGGRGLRIIRSLRELKGGLERAGAEAKTGFGRSDLYLEKYLDKPRHIEVQVIAGRRGKVLHLGERECSLQRRYQKILEETPSPVLKNLERKRLVGLALKVAQVTRYENAGTMEFIRSDESKFYYLETNKRIQVEHLITEMVTDVDIVEEQLRIASGDGLSLSQNEIEFSGSAINCRINAEDPSNRFAPTPGRVSRFVSPGGPGVRVDTALFDGCPVPEYYDSLIAKVACVARTREDAIRRMKIALAETVVEGVQTTIPLHQMLIENRFFVGGDYHTQLLDGILKDWQPRSVITSEEAAAVYAVVKNRMAIPSIAVPPGLARKSDWRSSFHERSNLRPALYVEGI